MEFSMTRNSFALRYLSISLDTINMNIAAGRKIKYIIKE